MWQIYSLAAVCMCLLPASVAQTDNVTKWKVYEYPNPRYQQQACGRRQGEVSWICDPNSLISTDDADEIQTILESTYQKTRCPCDECRDKQTGYVMMVALMPAMDRIIGGDDSAHSRLHDARVYSYYLSLYWNFTSCDENTLILYSQNDDVLYTTTWKNARKILTDAVVRDATLTTRRYFKTKERSQVGIGLKKLIQTYSDAFMRANEDRSKRSPKESRLKKLHQDEPIPVL